MHCLVAFSKVGLQMKPLFATQLFMCDDPVSVLEIAVTYCAMSNFEKNLLRNLANLLSFSYRFELFLRCSHYNCWPPNCISCTRICKVYVAERTAEDDYFLFRSIPKLFWQKDLEYYILKLLIGPYKYILVY